MKIFAFLFTVVISTSLFGQITIFDPQGGVVPNGSVFEVVGNPSDIEIEKVLWVVNDGSSSVDLKCRRVEIDVASGTTNNTCWVVCPVTPFNAGQRCDAVSTFNGTQLTETLAPGDTGKTFALHYTPENLDACSWFRVMWFEGNDEDNFLAYVDLKFNHATSCTLGKAGDANSNTVIDGSEIAGDVDNSGVIEVGEISGDLNGDGVIGCGEVAGDVDGNGVVDGNEIVGDVNGNGTIDSGEEMGDSNGDGLINNQEVGIEEVAANLKVEMYPNPANESALVKLNSNSSGNFTVYVFDVLGKKIADYTMKDNQTVINTQDLNDGMYFVSILNKGEVVKTSKLNIKH